MDKKVQILMSTYNGEKYLEEQIESLLRQTYPHIEILIRDDGSTDSTSTILKKYEKEYGNIHVFLESNVGVTKSFFSLLSKSDADYIAFCDQDDIWLEEKVERAVEKLCEIQGAALYCSNKILVDAESRIIGENKKTILKPGFGNAVVECICTGCTAVMNRELAEIIKNHIPENAILHDWWCYLVACYVGQVVFDEEAYIWYRQHGGNVVGQSNGIVGNLKAKAKYLKNNRGKLRKQLTEFQQIYHQQDEKDRIVKEILESENWRKKAKAVFSKKYYRQSKADQWIVRGLLLFNRML
ncbi:MAG: glycosyltransferase family 2 protein [Lachnospiraceae bacterium]